MKNFLEFSLLHAQRLSVDPAPPHACAIHTRDNNPLGYAAHMHSQHLTVEIEVCDMADVPRGNREEPHLPPGSLCHEGQ